MKSRKLLKKYAALTMAVIMGFTMVSCKGKSGGSKETSKGASESETEKKEGKDAVILNDGDVLVDINFDDGDTDGFITYINGGAEELSNEDGKLCISISDCGSLDYANQIYWDGFILNQGAEYTYSFDISSDIERKVEYRLQINGGDYHAYQGEKIDIGPDTLNYSVDFTMDENSDPAPRIVFNMGMMEDMTQDPGPHKIYIDNIKLVVKDATNAQVLEGIPVYNKVVTNEIGYRPDDVKTVMVEAREDTTYKVINSETGETVLEEDLAESVYNPPTGEYVQLGDFSEITEPGTYYISCATGDSYEFEISDHPYEDMYKDTILMLYRQRCGMKLEGDAALDFGHDECHMSEATIYGTDKKKDVSGGWHDAGDYGRYVVPGAKTVEDLFLSYEDYGIEDDDLGIPESGNNVPDILDEARYELEWMLKMQDEESGGFYHKVTCKTFPETVMPTEETDELILAPISTTASANACAVLLKASLIYEKYDSDFAVKCLDAAKKAWKYVDSCDKSGFTNPKDIVTGEYKDATTDDEVLWAAVMMNIAAGEDLDLESFMTDKVSAKFDWASIGGYAYYELAKSDLAESSTAKDKILKMADEKKALADVDMYNMILEKNYPWGSNMTIANAGILFNIAYNLTGDDEYKVLAKQQVDYLLGANSMAYCFVTGYGEQTPEHPHHRPSQATGKCVPGMLVGGANSNLEDPYAAAVLYEEVAPECYADNDQSYSTNEVAIYWNSPLIYDLSAIR